LSRGRGIVPIFGAKHVAYVEENVAAAGVTLSAADLEALERAAPAGAAAGLRYPQAGLATLNR
jgi:aryl-alcohol dehydrogenase-like predicted oxidoreductase